MYEIKLNKHYYTNACMREQIKYKHDRPYIYYIAGNNRYGALIL